MKKTNPISLAEYGSNIICDTERYVEECVRKDELNWNTPNLVIPAKYQTKLVWKMPNMWRAILSAIRECRL